MASYVIAGGTLLYLILSFFPWYSFGQDFFGFSLSGWTAGNVKTAFFLFLLASVWALLPAFTDLKLGFPRSWITVGLAALGFVLTLFAWIDTFDVDFSFWALLGMLTAAAILAFAVLALLPGAAQQAGARRAAGRRGPVGEPARRPSPARQPGQPSAPRASASRVAPYGPPAQQYGHAAAAAVRPPPAAGRPPADRAVPAAVRPAPPPGLRRVAGWRDRLG